MTTGLVLVYLNSIDKADLFGWSLMLPICLFVSISCILFCTRWSLGWFWSVFKQYWPDRSLIGHLSCQTVCLGQVGFDLFVCLLELLFGEFYFNLPSLTFRCLFITTFGLVDFYCHFWLGSLLPPLLAWWVLLSVTIPSLKEKIWAALPRYQ